jgi:hypothetical protein
MTWIKEDKTNDISYSHNFVAPDGTDDLVKEVLFPLAEVFTPDYAATLAVEVKQMDNFIQPAELTGNATINLTINDQVTAGAKLHLKLDADSTGRAITLGTGFAGLSGFTVVADTVWCVSFVYDGTSFLPMYSAPSA